MLAAQLSPVSTTAFAVVVLVTSTTIVAALAWAARRLMGSPVGALRALIAGAGPGGSNLEAAAPSAAGQSPAGVQGPVAEGLTLGLLVLPWGFTYEGSPDRAGKWTVSEEVRKRRRSRKTAGKAPQAATTGPVRLVKFLLLTG
jgi:hypothetical protein